MTREVPAAAAPDRPDAPSSALRGFTAALSAVIGGFMKPMTPTEARDEWRAHEAASRRVEPVRLHVHVPFCHAICTYCDCATDALQAPTQLTQYLDALAAEVAFFDGVVARPIDRLYVGGGTPNILSESQLERLLGVVHRSHRFVENAMKCVEGHPVYSTRAKLDVAAAFGVNRVSYGVQSRDPQVLKRVNRGGQSDADVERCVRDAFDAGIREVNLDFIHGLADEPTESSFAGVVWALSLRPTTVCLQLLNDSQYAAPYRDTAHRAKVAIEFRDLEARVAEWVAAHAPDYECASRPDTIVVRRRDIWRDLLRTPEYYAARDPTFMSTLGYGRHAQSTLYGRLIYQNQERNGRFDPDATQYAGRPRSPALEALIHIVSAWEHQRIADVGELRETHDGAAWSEIEPLLERLEHAGHLERSQSSIRATGLTPDGIQWLAEQIVPASNVVASGMDGIRIVERDSTWHIRMEPARAESRYFAVIRGIGLFYQTDATKTPDPAIVARIMRAVVRHAEHLLGDGCEEAQLATEIAAVLDARLAEVGLKISAKVESSRTRRYRLTTLAPS